MATAQPADDPKGRLISMFAGAILLPSLALSYVSIDFVQKLAKARKASEVKRAQDVLHYIEKELAHSARTKAREAARLVGMDRLLDGRMEVVRPALREAGVEADTFESLWLEGSSPRALIEPAREHPIDSELPRELLRPLDAFAGGQGEDAVPWISDDGRSVGTLRFKFACDYVHKALVRDYFEKEFRNPEQALVVRVSESEDHLVYETAPTHDGRFEVKRAMQSPSFKGLTLFLRYKDLSIEQDVQRWKMWTLALIAFIDLVLGAGLLLVYANVRREVHLSRLKSDFVANVSHELKTPLALIRLFAETLEMGRVPSEQKALEYYRVIHKESQRLTQLINNILDFSRIEAGRKEYYFGRTDVSEVIGDVVEAYRFQIEQQGFRLDVDVEAGLPEVRADREALGQALLNLLNNAIKYSHQEKEIDLKADRDDHTLRISVADRGIGVSKSEQKKIFEKFYRAEDSLVHETRGSGLGLPLVRHIMEAHGGRVEMESTVGKGSRFTLVLPIPGEGDRDTP
jgi:signal transduction histidine kinase